MKWNEWWIDQSRKILKHGEKCQNRNLHRISLHLWSFKSIGIRFCAFCLNAHINFVHCAKRASSNLTLKLNVDFQLNRNVAKTRGYRIQTEKKMQNKQISCVNFWFVSFYYFDFVKCHCWNQIKWNSIELNRIDWNQFGLLINASLDFL